MYYPLTDPQNFKNQMFPMTTLEQGMCKGGEKDVSSTIPQDSAVSEQTTQGNGVVNMIINM